MTRQYERAATRLITAPVSSLTCQCANTITDPCIVCGKGKTLVTAEWLQKMAAKEGDLECTTGAPVSSETVDWEAILEKYPDIEEDPSFADMDIPSPPKEWK